MIPSYITYIPTVSHVELRHGLFSDAQQLKRAFKTRQNDVQQTP